MIMEFKKTFLFVSNNGNQLVFQSLG